MKIYHIQQWSPKLLRLLLVFFLLFFLALPNHGGTCTQSGPIPHAIRTNPLPCQKKAVILQSHSALESHSRYRSTKSAGDQGLCSPQKSEIFGGPKKDASLTKVSSRVRDLQRFASPPLHEITTIAPHNLHDPCVARV